MTEDVTVSQARLYCGHDTGPPAAGCSRHERGGDPNDPSAHTFYYWCDNSGPVQVSCTCGEAASVGSGGVNQRPGADPPVAQPLAAPPRQCDMTGDDGVAVPAACADTSNGATNPGPNPNP